MTGKQAIEQQYELFYRVMRANLADMTAEQSLLQPSPGGNCANWILAHVIAAHNAVMDLAGEAPVMDPATVERARAEPVTGPDEGYDWSEMTARFEASMGRCLAAIGRLSDAQLEEGGFTDPFGTQVTRGGLLNLLAMHQNYHAGQLGLSRRLAGLPGVIRAPEPQTAG